MKRTIALIFLTIAILLCAANARSACTPPPGGVIFLPQNVCWHCTLPIRIGGVMVLPGPPENAYRLPWIDKPVCVCPIIVAGVPVPRPGIPFHFFEPSRYGETVRDPFCFPSLGGINIPAGAFGYGSKHEKTSDRPQKKVAAQAHYFVFLPWAIAEILLDFVCLELSGFDIAFLSEVDPLWQDELLTFLISPESLLFANPIAQIACLADSIPTQLGFANPITFWCNGSGGSVYPLNGREKEGESLQAHENIMARMQYLMARQLLVCDTGVWPCFCVITPIWLRNNYRIHIAMPVRDFWCHPFGRTDLVWGPAKNTPPFGENFVWMLFRRRTCCAF